MITNRFRAGLMAGGASLVLSSFAVERVHAAEGAAPVPPVENVLITGTGYRDRSAETAPVLEYGPDYFQPFEPLTVGDMLKRTPSVAFVSDILEYDGVRLRGLDPGYTQILINGRRVPGADVDRSFWVDRIPAELIERVEIVRSASANRSGDAVAGALNIVLRDPYAFEGAYARAGGLYFDDGKIKPVLGAVISGPIGPARGLIGFNMQGRHNPKEKVSYRYEPDDGVLEFASREDQSDVRNGTDYSANGELNFPIATMGAFSLTGFWVHTDRTETELSTEYEDMTSLDPADIVTVVPQFEDINQDNYAFAGDLMLNILGGETGAELAYSSFKDDVVSTEEETEYDPFPDVDDFGGTRTFTNTDDAEWSGRLTHMHRFMMLDAQIGFDYVSKERDGLETEAEIDDPGDSYPDPEPVDGGFFRIEETRFDPFVQLNGNGGMFAWEAGLRYETTDSSIVDLDTGDEGGSDYSFLLPSGHVRVNLSMADRLSLSAARTVRRPNFSDLSPLLREEEPTEDNDLLGNPDLKPESAWGFDAGYERRLGTMGVTGVNFFYRKITDLIELASTGDISSGGEGVVLQPQNVGDGEVWGVEFDFSAPLTVIGLDDTGLFLNYAWLDSSVTDPVTGQERRFNNQAKSVLNIGFIQDVPSYGFSFGASYRKQGEAFAVVAGETVRTTYDGDLEAFLEKRIGENFVIRLTGSNLLNAKKAEVFDKWDTVADQLSGDPDALNEHEVESEQSGPVFQLVGRVVF